MKFLLLGNIAIMDESIFRSYDIRGKYPFKISEKVVYDIASRLGAVFGKGKVVAGHDARLSSMSLYRALIRGLEAAGFGVVNIGLVTTPMLVFFVRRFRASGGVTITASHNPKNDNGLGVIDENGMSVGGKEILKKVESGKWPARFALRSKAGGKVESGDRKAPKGIVKITRGRVLGEYASFLEKLFDVKKPVKIVIDCSNGAAGPVVKKLRFPKNIRTVLLNLRPDGNFSAHGPDPTKQGAWRQAAAAVVKHRADLGVVFDGDGDRALFLDNKGKVVRSEHVWRLFLANNNYHAAVFSVTEAYMVHLINCTLTNSGQKFKLIESKVGHLMMRRECTGQKNAIGFESSMHYYFPDDKSASCAILAAIKTINSLSRLPYLFSDFISFLPQTIRLPEINRRYKRNHIGRIYKAIVRAFSRDSRHVYYKDGISVTGDDWWFNVRPSNTQDFIRINIEGENGRRVQNIRKRILRLL